MTVAVPLWLTATLALYFALNLYFTGRWADRLDGEAWWRQLLYHVGGILFFSGIAAYAIISHGVREFASFFQITFLYKLLVLNKFEDGTPEQFERYESYLYPTSTLRGRIQRVCLALWKKKVAKRQPHSNTVA